MKKLFQKYPWLPFSLFFLFFGVGTALWIALTLTAPTQGRTPSTLMEQDVLRGLFSAAVAVLLSGILWIRRISSSKAQRKATVAVLSTLIAVTIASGILYFYTHRGMTSRDYLNFHDIYHYFLGCKYYEETEYTELYGCHLKADQEREDPHFKNNSPVRNLKTYQVTTAVRIREDADCSRFSKKRWEEFKKDTALFSDHLTRGALQDHGYNGTPFSAAIAGSIANLPIVTYRNLVYLTFIDLFGLCLLFGLITWGFGPQIGFLVALFQFVNFGDYYYHVSFFRYWWLITLGTGIVFLHRKHFGIAAFFLTASAMLNVFPILFIAGFAIKIAVDTVVRRDLSRSYRIFVGWSVVAVLLFGAVSLVHENPVRRYSAFFSKMDRHAGLMTTTRTGFRYNFAFRPTTEEVPKPAEAVIGQLRTLYKQTTVPRLVLTALIIGLFSILLVRLEDYQAALLGGFMLLFMLFSTVVYYYACAALLPMLWVNDIHRKRGVAMIALLFGLMSAVYLPWWAFHSRAFANNTALTASFTIYLAATYIVLALNTGLFEKWGTKPHRMGSYPST